MFSHDNNVANFVNGATLILSFDMSNTVSPGVSSILSLIVSRFSNGYFSRDVLFVEYIAVTYQVLITFVVSILMALPVASQSPKLSTVKICSLACMLVFTLNLISSFVNVFGLSIIALAEVISPNAFGISSLFGIFSPFICAFITGDPPIM